MMSKILIVDSTNNFIRCYSVIPTMDVQGNMNGGVVGFLRSLSLFVHHHNPDKIILVWDGQNGSKKRRTIIKDYKEGRKPTRLNRDPDFNHGDPEQNKIYQRLRLGEYLQDLPVYQMSIPDVEADDVIAYLTKMFSEDEKVIVSNDKDFFQLLGDKISIFSPTKKEFFCPEKVHEIFGVYPVNFAIARAIVGDDSDNLKGIKGIAFKKLVKLFPFMTQSEKVTLDQLFKFCEDQGEKYKRFLDGKQIIIDNHKVMQLEDPIIGLISIQKIEHCLEKDITFNATSFRMKSYADGITTFNDGFYQPFRALLARKG
jgi:DNA polymerase I